jgi:hypothetical protein
MRRLAPLCAVSLLVGAAALAGQLAGVSLPDQTEAAGKTLVLNGLGLREATLMMVDVYVAGLYLESKTSDAEAILGADRAKRLVLTFVRSVGREKLVEAWSEGLEKNAGEKRATVADGFARMNAAMTDVKKGDTVVLTYLPGQGTTVEVRGKASPPIEGDDFQAVLFSIWLGSQPPNVGLRDGLLGVER